MFHIEEIPKWGEKKRCQSSSLNATQKTWKKIKTHGEDLYDLLNNTQLAFFCFLENYDTGKNMHSRQDTISPISLQATLILEISLLFLSYAGEKVNAVVLIFKKLQSNHPYISTVCNKCFGRPEHFRCNVVTYSAMNKGNYISALQNHSLTECLRWEGTPRGQLI